MSEFKCDSLLRAHVIGHLSIANDLQTIFQFIALVLVGLHFHAHVFHFSLFNISLAANFVAFFDSLVCPYSFGRLTKIELISAMPSIFCFKPATNKWHSETQFYHRPQRCTSFVCSYYPIIRCERRIVQAPTNNCKHSIEFTVVKSK